MENELCVVCCVQWLCCKQVGLQSELVILWEMLRGIQKSAERRSTSETCSEYWIRRSCSGKNRREHECRDLCLSGRRGETNTPFAHATINQFSNRAQKWRKQCVTSTVARLQACVSRKSTSDMVLWTPSLAEWALRTSMQFFTEYFVSRMKRIHRASLPYAEILDRASRVQTRHTSRPDVTLLCFIICSWYFFCLTISSDTSLQLQTRNLVKLHSTIWFFTIITNSQIPWWSKCGDPNEQPKSPRLAQQQQQAKVARSKPRRKNEPRFERNGGPHRWWSKILRIPLGCPSIRCHPSGVLCRERTRGGTRWWIGRRTSFSSHYRELASDCDNHNTNSNTISIKT